VRGLISLEVHSSNIILRYADYLKQDADNWGDRKEKSSPEFSSFLKGPNVRHNFNVSSIDFSPHNHNISTPFIHILTFLSHASVVPFDHFHVEHKNT